MTTSLVPCSLFVGTTVSDNADSPDVSVGSSVSLFALWEEDNFPGARPMQLSPSGRNEDETSVPGQGTPSKTLIHFGIQPTSKLPENRPPVLQSPDL
jgi:hypothetical protein